MKTQQELCDILGFIAEYATYQLGSGVHTSRVIRNAQRIGEALGVDVQLSSFQKSTILTVLDTVSGESATRVVAIPSLPISFERNSDLSALSWDALDEGLSLDGLFAAVAAIGFGAISDPPMRAFPRIALLAAIGHALRFTLIHCAALDIATASLFAAFAIGMGSLWLGRGVRCPMTCLYIPALLPMVPGIYAYKTVFSLIMFLQSLDRADEGMRYMQQFFLNATVSLSVIALLAAGATLPIFIFKRRAFSMTRRTRKNS